MKNIIFVLLVLFIVSCGPHDSITYVNNSTKKISVVCNTNSKSDRYSFMEFYIDSSRYILPKNEYVDRGGLDQNHFHKLLRASPTHKLFIYIFNVDSLIKYHKVDQKFYQMPKFIQQKMYDTLYAFSLEQLDSLKWIVAYSSK
ncbi:MAG: hypothetical protein H0U95_05925 [Bacteroidetes bacterium]|nr:hypothetical protein [Bacteroidota bacterium]